MGQPKICPFCGVSLTNRTRNDVFYHAKNGCLLQGSILMQEQLELWNTRKPVERFAERLEEKIKDYERHSHGNDWVMGALYILHNVRENVKKEMS